MDEAEFVVVAKLGGGIADMFTVRNVDYLTDLYDVVFAEPVERYALGFCRLDQEILDPGIEIAHNFLRDVVDQVLDFLLRYFECHSLHRFLVTDSRSGAECCLRSSFRTPSVIFLFRIAAFDMVCSLLVSLYMIYVLTISVGAVVCVVPEVAG
jgi:hypothetical protein